MIKKKTPPYLIILILIAFAISPAIALGEGNRNLLLICVMGLSPFIILNYARFDRINTWLILFMVSIVIIPLIHQPQSMRWSTVLYSFMFSLTFIAYQELLNQSYFTPKKYLKILKYLILAYFIVLLIQQFCVLTGLPIFNLSNYDPSNRWKLNSLASEPSHSARIVALLMYCYVTIKKLVTNRKYSFKLEYKKDKWIWISFIWTMATMGSGTAFLFLALVLLMFVRFKNLISVFILAGGIFLLYNFFEIGGFERVYKTVVASSTLDKNLIIETDHSASTRIVPFIILFEMGSLNSLNGWFGHGVDYVSGFLSDVMPGLKEGTSGGGLLSLWIEYGFISFGLFIIFSLTTTLRKNHYLTLVFWVLVVLLIGVNSQITWLAIILLFTNKYFLIDLK
jgi:hypothetical protein